MIKRDNGTTEPFFISNLLRYKRDNYQLTKYSYHPPQRDDTGGMGEQSTTHKTLNPRNHQYNTFLMQDDKTGWGAYPF